jgi:glycosyltransferase involved in cell wall biosynthesis
MGVTFSFIFQIHNREETIQELLLPFIEAQNNGYPSELIVCNDGSTDHTGDKIQGIMATATHSVRNTVMTMYDAYETLLCWRAIQIAEGEFLVLVQDDDYYSSMEFADRALLLFNADQQLAALSPKHGLLLHPHSLDISTIYGEYESSDFPITQPDYSLSKILYVDIIDRAPMFIRHAHYKAIGGIDRNLERAVYNDWDMCLSWKEQNLRIGIYHADSYQFRRWYPGSMLPGAETHIYTQNNRAKVYAKHFGKS